jgi:hypothetical protein
MSTLLEDYGSTSHIPLEIAYQDTVFIGVFGIVVLFILILAVRRNIRMSI